MICYIYLDEDIEGDVEVPAVHKHVGEEAPQLLLLVRVEEEDALDVDWPVGSHGLPSLRQQTRLVDEDCNLCTSIIYTIYIWSWCLCIGPAPPTW